MHACSKVPRPNPISIEHNFKFLVLLPLEASEKIEALKQYYGVTQEGQLVVRGVEIRRHDTPNLIKEFQTELLSTLFDCKSKEEIINTGYENALLLVTRAIDKIMLGGEENIAQEDLVISKLLGQNLEKYRSLFPHVSAAIQLSNDDKHPSKGDTIKYIYTDSRTSYVCSSFEPLSVAALCSRFGGLASESLIVSEESVLVLECLSSFLSADSFITSIESYLEESNTSGIPFGSAILGRVLSACVFGLFLTSVLLLIIQSHVSIY
jgi:hypothetical protein